MGKPDFNPMEDAFMKRFDENGNFVNPPKPDELEVVDEEVFPPKVNYVYVFKQTSDDNKKAE